MKLKNVVSVLVGIAIFGTSALAAYPEHSALSIHPGSVNGISVGASPAENVFSVDGKKFILLDTDSLGNYFVMTEDIYGTHYFVDNSSSIDINGWDGVDSDWYYNPQNEASVAHWLNNGFLENGNGEGKKLPQGIISNLVESDWVVENNFPFGQGQVTVEKVGQQSYDKYQAWKANRAGVRTVRSKVALMSFTEYSTYKNKIGHYFNTDINWIGFMLRTPASETTVANGAITVKNNFYQVRTITNNTVVAATPNGNIVYEYQIRPVFWLDKDFFADVKVDVTSVGANVLNELKKHSYTDMADIYTDEELSVIGYDTSTRPMIDNIIVTGFKCVNALNEVFYDYLSVAGKTEQSTMYEKYISDTDTGEFDFLTSSDSVSYTDGETEGKFIKLALIPEDSDGIRGKRFFSKIFELGAEKPVVVTECEFVGAENTEITSIAGQTVIGANITFSGAAQLHAITLVHYDKDNAVKNITKINTDSDELTYTLSLDAISVTTGDSVWLLVETATEGRPVYVKVVR